MYKSLQYLVVMLHRTILLVLLIIIGAFIFNEIEKDIDMGESTHFCWTVVTTIGLKLLPMLQ